MAQDPRSTARALGAVYFFHFAGIGTLFPILPVVFERRGLTPTEIGWVFTLIPVSAILIPPLWGAIADAWQARPALIRLATAGAALSVLPLGAPMSLAGTMLAVGAICCFRSAVTPLTDASTRALLADRGADYGRIRMWGSMGFAVAVTLAGEFSLAARPTWLVGVTSAGYGLAFLSAFALPRAKYERHPGVLKQAISNLGPLRWALLGTAAYYAGHSTYDVFFSLHLKSLGQSDRVIGLAWGVGVGAEIALMRFAPSLVRRFTPESRLTFCAVVAALRWVLVSTVAENTTALLCVQPLHALTFGLWYISLVDVIHARAPEHLRSTLQAAANMSMGAGMILGFLGGGPIFQGYGGSFLYLVSSGCAAAACLAYLVTWRSAARGPQPTLGAGQSVG